MNDVRRNSYRAIGVESLSKARHIRDFEQLAAVAHYERSVGHRIVLTSGSFDVIHIGHCRYIEKAKQHGDVLFVGIDSDEKIQSRKGPNRPLVPEEERVEMLTYLSSVDYVFTKNLEHDKWKLITTINPDTLIVTEDTYSEEQLEALSEHCGEVVVLERQAPTSTSEKIRQMQLSGASELGEMILKVVDDYKSKTAK